MLLLKNLFPARLIVTAKRLGTIYITFHKKVATQAIDCILLQATVQFPAVIILLREYSRNLEVAFHLKFNIFKSIQQAHRSNQNER